MGEVKIGAIIPYTGIAATVGKEIERGIQYVLDTAEWQVAGRRIILVKEDETDDPTVAVAKARKLVEQDKVDVVLGPLLAHTGAAVGAYLGPLGIPHLPMGASDSANSKDSFFVLGTGRGEAYPAAYFAYEDLGARTAAVLVSDYLYGHQNRDGFTSAFNEKGGKVVTSQAIPLGAADMAPFLEGLGKVDIVAAFLVNPSDMAFVRQYREMGLKMPVIFINCLPQEEVLLAQMGDNVLGMYGVTMYSTLIDTPENKKFVDEFTAKFGVIPGQATVYGGYWATALYLEGVKATGGDVAGAKVIDAMKNRQLSTPAGTLSISPGRIGIHDDFVFKAVKVGTKYGWQVVKKYPMVQPK